MLEKARKIAPAASTRLICRRRAKRPSRTAVLNSCRPSKSSGGVNPDDPVFGGELQNLRDASKPAAVAGVRGVFNIFRRNAGSLDRLTSYLRSQGFPVETPADTLDLLQQRLTQRKPVYGSYEREEAAEQMERSGAYYRQAVEPPRTPEELQGQADKWRAFLKQLSPKTAVRLEAVRRGQLADLWRGQNRVPDDVHAAYMDKVVYLVAEALHANPERTNVVNLLHEMAHPYERTLPKSTLKGLEMQWRAEMASGKSPLHNADGTPRADVDKRAFDTGKPENFGEYLAERLAWENAQWAEGKATPKGAIQRLAGHARDLLLRVYRAVRRAFGAGGANLGDEQVNADFRDWLAKGTPGLGESGTEAAGPQAAMRDWFKKFGRGSRAEPTEESGQRDPQAVSLGRENAAPSAGLDPVTGTPLDPRVRTRRQRSIADARTRSGCFRSCCGRTGRRSC